jgi:hypothetical protein
LIKRTDVCVADWWNMACTRWCLLRSLSLLRRSIRCGEFLLTGSV